MIGTGSLILTHNSGWSACKEAISGMEFDIRPDKTAKQTLIIQLKGLFDCVGQAKGQVKAMFKFDGGGKIAFSGTLQGRSRLIVTSEINNDFVTIIKEIKKWQFTKANY